MAVLRIRTYGDPILRQTARPVTAINEEVRQLAQDMIETMYANGGVGLASVQVGEEMRMFVVDTQNEEENAGPQVFINPSVSKKEGSTVMEEGCLSIPEVRADVRRAKSFDFEATNLDGEQVQMRAEGLFGRVLLHELDHLDGKLFIDYLSTVKRMLLKDQLDAIERESVTSR